MHRAATRPLLGLGCLPLGAACLLSAAACGPTRVQMYDGPALPDDEVTVLWSNRHLEVTVDRNYSVPVAEQARLHRIELPRGHHAVEVRCRYTGDVTYHARPAATEAPAPDGGAVAAQKFMVSPTIALVMDGEPGHAYKARVHFERTASGVPGCRARMFDVTAESGGHAVDLY